MTIYSKCRECGGDFVPNSKNRGVKYICKKCFGLKIMRGKGNDIGFKKCARCKLYLPISKYPPDKKARCRAYCFDCEQIIRTDRKEYFSEYGRQYKKLPEIKEKLAIARRACRKRHRDNLDPEYLKRLTIRYLPISEKEVPQEALEIKRAVVLLKRALK